MRVETGTPSDTPHSLRNRGSLGNSIPEEASFNSHLSTPDFSWDGEWNGLCWSSTWGRAARVCLCEHVRTPASAVLALPEIFQKLAAAAALEKLKS